MRRTIRSLTSTTRFTVIVAGSMSRRANLRAARRRVDGFTAQPAGKASTPARRAHTHARARRQNPCPRHLQEQAVHRAPCESLSCHPSPSTLVIPPLATTRHPLPCCAPPACHRAASSSLSDVTGSEAGRPMPSLAQRSSWSDVNMRELSLFVVRRRNKALSAPARRRGRGWCVRRQRGPFVWPSLE